MLRRATRRDVGRGSAEAAVVARASLRAVLGSAARVFGRDPRPLSFGFGRRGFYGGAANARTPENRTLSADTRAKDCSLAASALHAASFIIFTLWQPFFLAQQLATRRLHTQESRTHRIDRCRPSRAA